MKKITLLFLALSSLTLAAVTVTPGENTSSNETTSSININVTASVSAFETTSLQIVDDKGAAISSVDFHHNLDKNGQTLQGETDLSQEIYAIAGGLTTDRVSKITSEAPKEFVLTNQDDSNSTITTSFTTEKATSVDPIKGLKFTLKSSVPTDAANVIEGSYAGEAKTLTLTYNKQ